MKPIIFCTDMVKALLNTKPGVWPVEPIDVSKPYKSHTRRVIKPIPEYDFLYPEPIDGEWFWTECDTDDDMMGWWPSYENGLSAPYRVGDILYVRETWCKHEYGFDYKVLENGNVWGNEYSEKWKPSIHMAREASRIFLEVKSVRVERLQDITCEDAKNEGVKRDCGCEVVGYCTAFYKVWNALNAKRGYSWESNPWVWVYEFIRVEKS